jgi:hypothetical protein
MADVPAGLVSAYYEILQAGAGSYDPERLRSILMSDLDFDGPIAGHVCGADRFTRGVAGFIETQHGIRFMQQVVTHDAAAVLYDADLPGVRSDSRSSSVSTAGRSPRSNCCTIPPGTPRPAGAEPWADTADCSPGSSGRRHLNGPRARPELGDLDAATRLTEAAVSRTESAGKRSGLLLLLTQCDRHSISTSRTLPPIWRQVPVNRYTV